MALSCCQRPCIPIWGHGKIDATGALAQAARLLWRIERACPADRRAGFFVLKGALLCAQACAPRSIFAKMIEAAGLRDQGRCVGALSWIS